MNPCHICFTIDDFISDSSSKLFLSHDKVYCIEKDIRLSTQCIAITKLLRLNKISRTLNASSLSDLNFNHEEVNASPHQCRAMNAWEWLHFLCELIARVLDSKNNQRKNLQFHSVKESRAFIEGVWGRICALLFMCRH